jgi:hypothetical protein
VKSLDNETAILENIQYGNNVSKLCFHPFDNFLVVCDQQHSAWYDLCIVRELRVGDCFFVICCLWGLFFKRGVVYFIF